jgi:hypothetical protein
MNQKARLFAPLFVALITSLGMTHSWADEDRHPGEKPEPTLYSHEEHEEGDESLIADEEFFIVAGLVAGVGTVGFLLYRRGKSED